jgi:hypothetical protein
VREALDALNSPEPSSNPVFLNAGLELERQRVPTWLGKGSRHALVWLGGLATLVLAGVLTTVIVALLHL